MPGKCRANLNRVKGGKVELFKKMISMQHDLNIATNGLNYAVTTAHEMTGKKINWNRTAWTGAARFIETLGWKHWEHSKDDLDRAKVVLSDIWHSLMSVQLTRHAFLSGEVDDQTIESVASDAYLAFASRWENSKMDENHLDALIAPTGSPAWKTDLINGDNFLGSSSSYAAVSGYPSITVPMGFVDELPVGISFFGRAWSEPLLIEIAYSFEQGTKYRQRPKYLNN